MKYATYVFAQRSSQKTFLIPKFVIDTINLSLDLMLYNLGSDCACDFKLASHFVLV